MKKHEQEHERRQGAIYELQALLAVAEVAIREEDDPLAVLVSWMHDRKQTLQRAQIDAKAGEAVVHLDL